MLKIQHQRFVISLVLAILIHALLLLLITNEKKQLNIEFSEQSPSMSVSLDALYIASTNINSQKYNKKLANPTITEINKKLIKKSKKNNIVEKAPLLVNTDTITPSNLGKIDDEVTELQNTQFHESKMALNRAKIIANLRKDLKQFFYYPRIARRKNIQGTVLLGFGINRTGEIHDIHVIKSSGHISLDLAAEDSMQKLHKVNWAKGMLAKSDISLELPVIYELME